MNPFKYNKLFWFLFVVGFFSIAFLQYYGLIHYRYLVPPGDDPFNHYQIAKKFLNNTSDLLDTWKSGGYPPLYHITMAKIAKIFSLDLLQTINWTYPSIIIFASLSIFFSTYYLFGPYEGLTAFLLYGITAKSSLQLQFDGGFPNLIAAHVLLPLFILFFIKFFTSKENKNRIIYCLVSIILAILILLTHHISTFYLAGIVLVSIPLLILDRWKENKWSVSKKITAIITVFFFYATLFLLFEKTELFSPIKALLDYASNNFDSAGRWGLLQYPQGIGTVISLFSFLGFFHLLLINKNWPIRIVLTTWVALLFCGSRVHMANPERIARDLVVPLSILAGYFIVKIFQIPKPTYFKIILGIMISAFIYPKIICRIDRAIHYEPMIRTTSADKSAITELNSKFEKTILTNEVNPYLPIFLEQKTIAYYYSNIVDPAYADQFDYLYLVKNQEGWVPESDYVGFFQNIDQLNFQKISEFSSPTNATAIFKNKKLL